MTRSPLNSELELVADAVGRGHFHLPTDRKAMQIHSISPTFLKDVRIDALRLIKDHEGSVVAKKGHVTNWTNPYGDAIQYSLWNTSGNFSDTSTDHNGSPDGKHFHHREQYPSLAKLIDQVPSPNNFRLNVMGPNSGLSPHEENVVFRAKDGTLYCRMRFHLPLVSVYPDVKMLLDWDEYYFAPGIIHYFNNGCVHAASNNMNLHRIHLVWDMWLTQQTWDWIQEGTDVLYPMQSKIIVPIGKVEPTDYAKEGNREVTVEEFLEKGISLR